MNCRELCRVWVENKGVVKRISVQEGDAVERKESEGNYGVERSWAFMADGPWTVTQQRGSIAGYWHIVLTDGMNNAPPAVIDSE